MACASSAQWVAKGPSFLHADSEDWSGWADAQADLSLRWVHMLFCWFCHDAAQFLVSFLRDMEQSDQGLHYLPVCLKVDLTIVAPILER